MVDKEKARALLAARFISGAIDGGQPNAADISRAMMRIGEVFQAHAQAFTEDETAECRAAIDRAYEWMAGATKTLADALDKCSEAGKAVRDKVSATSR